MGMEKAVNTKRKRYLYCFLAFTLTIVCLLIVYALWKQYPFGDNTLLIWDMHWQYSNFLAYLHDILHGEANLLYSMSVAIGGDFYSIASYYLFSPFNIIFYFFDSSNIYIGVLILTLLKIGTASVTMNVYLQRFEISLRTVPFAIAYALSAPVIAYSTNIMWMDAIIILPLMIAGIEDLIEKKNSVLYIISLAYGLLTCFFMGYILCVASVIYFTIYLCFLKKNTLKNSVKTICNYSISSVIAGGISAITVIPYLYVAQKGKNGLSKTSLFEIITNFERYFKLKNIVKLQFIGMMDHENQIMSTLPCIFCGIGVMIFFYMFFVNKHIAKRLKAGYGIISLGLIISFWLCNLDSIWQGFYRVTGSLHRYAYVFVFIVITIACRGYIEWSRLGEKEKTKVIMIDAIIMFILYCFFFYLIKNWYSRLLLNLVVITGYFLLMIISRWNMKYIKTEVLFITLLCVELCTNAFIFYHNNPQYSSLTRQKYVSRQTSIMQLSETLPEPESYRTVIMQGASTENNSNTSFLYHLHGLESYTSMENKETHATANNLGFSNNIVCGMKYGYGSTQAADSILGVQYYLHNQNESSKGEVINQSKDIVLSKNETALPLLYLVKNNLKITNQNEQTAFEKQEYIYQSLAVDQHPGRIFEDADISKITSQNCMISNGKYCIQDNSEQAYVDIHMKIQNSNCYYLLCHTDDIQNLEVICNSNDTSIYNQFTTITPLGHYVPGDNVIVRITLLSEYELDLSDVSIKYENTDILKMYSDMASKQKIHTSAVSENKWNVVCEIDSEKEQYLFWSIPSDDGWMIKVDNTKANVSRALGNLTVIAIPPGNHTVTMQYFPKGLCCGMVLSGVSVFALAILIMRKKTKKVQEVL